MKVNEFNKYLIFERHIYNFYMSFNPEFIRKTKINKHYIREFKPVRKQRKTNTYKIIDNRKKPIKAPIKRSIRKGKINKLCMY